MRRISLITIALLMLSCCVVQSADWAKFSRYAKANEKITSRPDVVFMGNSITDFWASRDSTFFTSNNFVGRGVSGQTSCEMLVRFRRDVIDLHPRAVVILAGINDIAHNNGEIELANVAGNIQSMCELAIANEIKPIVCSVLPCNKFVWRKDMHPGDSVKILNNMIRKFAAAADIPFVDYYTSMAQPDGSIMEELTYDGCHPNAEGYKIMETIILKEVKAVVKR